MESSVTDLEEGKRLLAASKSPHRTNTRKQSALLLWGIWAEDNAPALMEEVERLRRRECKLCVDWDDDEHLSECCPHKYGCCGKACPNCNNRGTSRG